MGQPRAAPARFDDVLYGGIRAGNECFDAAIRQIPNPTVQRAFFRFAGHPIPKPDALYATANDETKGKISHRICPRIRRASLEFEDRLIHRKTISGGRMNRPHDAVAFGP